MYDFELQTWSQLPDMQTERYGHGGGTAKKLDGSIEAVVAGGNGDVKTIEILEMSDAAGAWRYVMFLGDDNIVSIMYKYFSVCITYICKLARYTYVLH